MLSDFSPLVKVNRRFFPSLFSEFTLPETGVSAAETVPQPNSDFLDSLSDSIPLYQAFFLSIHQKAARLRGGNGEGED